MPRGHALRTGALGGSAGAAGTASEPGCPALVWPLMGFSDKPLGLLCHLPSTPRGTLAPRAPPGSFEEHRRRRSTPGLGGSAGECAASPQPRTRGRAAEWGCGAVHPSSHLLLIGGWFLCPTADVPHSCRGNDASINAARHGDPPAPQPVSCGQSPPPSWELRHRELRLWQRM